MFGCGDNSKGQLNNKYKTPDSFELIYENVDSVSTGGYYSLIYFQSKKKKKLIKIKLNKQKKKN